MTEARAMIWVFAATVVLLVGLGVWVGYRNGDLFFTKSDRIANHEVPKALSEAELQLVAGQKTDGNKPATTTTMTDITSKQKTNESNPTVTLKTTQGDIVFELYQDVMPITTGNFLALAKKGFYTTTKFHRVINGFMIQGGDPNSKTDAVATYGMGGPGYTIKDEFVKNEKLSNVRGTIAMANTGQPDSGGSQFFINLVDNIGLDFDKPPDASKHPVFGKVIVGMDIVDKIAKVPTNKQDVPFTPVMITDVVVGK